MLIEAIRSGLMALRSDAEGYREHARFDIVRRPARRTAVPPAQEREVFVLCSFGETYDQYWELLRLRLEGVETPPVASSPCDESPMTDRPFSLASGSTSSRGTLARA